MKIDLYQVDAFTDQLFTGNPAAVCPLDEWLPDEKMQQVAAENNLSETAFFVMNGKAIDLRWFTPVAEMDLCGHATLATAHVLFNHLNYDHLKISCSTRSGELTVRRMDSGWYMMNFPIKELDRTEPPEGFLEVFDGITFSECYRSDDYLLVADSREQVEDLNPDFRLLSEFDCRGVIVTAPGEDVDFVSRFFAPAVGVDEDSVTGSAHTMLTPYWANRLDKTGLTARQISSRGGYLKCKLVDSRVEISGQAVTFLTGEIEVPIN